MEKPKRNWWRLLRDGAVASVFFGPVLAIWQGVDDLLSVNAGLALLALTCGLLSFGALLYMNAIMPTWDEIYWSTYG